MAANVKNLPLSVIFAAKSGDGQALGAVLNHYQRYIRSLATRTLTDECGGIKMCIRDRPVPGGAFDQTGRGACHPADTRHCVGGPSRRFGAGHGGLCRISR